MLFTQKTLTTLEFNRILEMLLQCAPTAGARAAVPGLTPSDDYETVVLRQDRTEGARRLLSAKGQPPFYDGDAAPAEAADRAEKGAVLSVRELRDIAAVFRCARMMLDYIDGNHLFDTVLDPIFRRFMVNNTIEQKIGRALPTEDEVADEASPLLSDIRRKIRLANNKIKDTLQNFISGPRIKYLQENIVTMRDGRYVVPVKSEYRNEIRGLLHDTSSSGATVFIEPMGVVEANNELRELSSREQHEVDRILAELSSMCGEFAASVRQNCANNTELAFCFACAALAEKTGGARPQIVRETVVDLRRAYHPLLERSTAVPLDVTLGKSYRTLIITGPNTGGKTVALKTIGLLALMVQAGLQIPADESSVIGVFEEILADIGDEQSIKQSLSTFSSHMTNTIRILEQTGPHSLILFDELGAGTDPVEGAALATAILEQTQRLGALTAATTHYAELKAYALQTEGVQNASCEFDVRTLRPTYHLIIGTPGKSNAFVISERLGLPRAIVERAEALLSEESKHFEQVIGKLEESRGEMERERGEAERLRLEYTEQLRRAEEDIRRRLAETERRTKIAEEEARRLLDSARATSEFIFKELDTVKKKREQADFAAALERARNEVRDSLRAADRDAVRFHPEELQFEENYELPRPLRLGDVVYIPSYGQQGTVVGLPDKKGMVAVQAGIMRAKLPQKQLRLIEHPEKLKKAATAQGGVRRSVTVSFKPEIDVRGQTGDDAWVLIDKYLDDAVLSGVQSVRIIHGKGTGALRRAIWEYLKTDPRIGAYRPGVFGEGDAGVTVVELR